MTLAVTLTFKKKKVVEIMKLFTMVTNKYWEDFQIKSSIFKGSNGQTWDNLSLKKNLVHNIFKKRITSR